MKTIIVLLFLCTTTLFAGVVVKTSKDASSDQTMYAARKLNAYLKLSPVSKETGTIQLSIDKKLGAEAYSILTNKNAITISGGDGRGIIYGSYALIEQFKAKKSITTVDAMSEKPTLAFRALKFNLPFNPYRTDPALTQHEETCRDLKFWEAYLDMMAENRFNTLSLWSLHPFHLMVKPKSFPEAYPFNDKEFAEWKKFWTTLFHMAKERGLDTYIVNWNIFVSPALAKARNLAAYHSEGGYFGETDTSSAIIEQYTREVTRQVIDEYPELDGLGITFGERMGGMDTDQRRAWLDRTILAGMKEAKRKIKFIYRAPLSANTHSAGSVSEENDLKSRHQIESIDTEGTIWTEFKYNWSHGHSSPNLFIVHGGKLSDKYRNPVPEKYKYVWTVRNEDIFVLRWGQPDFIREFLTNNTTQAYVGGCIIGSEVFIPAKDYVTKPGPQVNWNYHFERQWLLYKMWGRLSYNPATPDMIFQNALANRFGDVVSNDLLSAWKTASKAPLMFASYHRGTWDGTLYTEGFCNWKNLKVTEMFDINSIINHPVLDTIRYINIKKFVDNGCTVDKGIMSPIVVADSLERIYLQAQALVKSIKEKAAVSPILDCELKDIEAW